MPTTAMVSRAKAILASLNQPAFSGVPSVLKALKKEKVANKLATRESIDKKCPNCPGKRCSFKYFMLLAYTVFVIKSMVIGH